MSENLDMTHYITELKRIEEIDTYYRDCSRIHYEYICTLLDEGYSIKEVVETYDEVSLHEGEDGVNDGYEDPVCQYGKYSIRGTVPGNCNVHIVNMYSVKPIPMSRSTVHLPDIMNFCMEVRNGRLDNTQMEVRSLHHKRLGTWLKRYIPSMLTDNAQSGLINLASVVFQVYVTLSPTGLRQQSSVPHNLHDFYKHCRHLINQARLNRSKSIRSTYTSTSSTHHPQHQLESEFRDFQKYWESLISCMQSMVATLCIYNDGGDTKSSSKSRGGVSTSETTLDIFESATMYDTSWVHSLSHGVEQQIMIQQVQIDECKDIIQSRRQQRSYHEAGTTMEQTRLQSRSKFCLRSLVPELGSTRVLNVDMTPTHTTSNTKVDSTVSETVDMDTQLELHLYQTVPSKGNTHPNMGKSDTQSPTEMHVGDNNSEPGNRGRLDIDLKQMGVLETGVRLWHWVEIQLDLLRSRTVDTRLPHPLLKLACDGVDDFLDQRLAFQPDDNMVNEIRQDIYEHLLVGHAHLAYCRYTGNSIQQVSSNLVFGFNVHPVHASLIQQSLTGELKDLLRNPDHPYLDVLFISTFGYFFQVLTRGIPFRQKYYASHFRMEDFLRQYVPSCAEFATLVKQTQEQEPFICHLLGQWVVVYRKHVIWVRSGREALAAWCLLVKFACKNVALGYSQGCSCVTDSVLSRLDPGALHDARKWVEPLTVIS